MPIRVSWRSWITYKFICFGYELQLITIVLHLFYRGYQYCFHDILFLFSFNTEMAMWKIMGFYVTLLVLLRRANYG